MILAEAQKTKTLALAGAEAAAIKVGSLLLFSDMFLSGIDQFDIYELMYVQDYVLIPILTMGGFIYEIMF